MDIPRIPTGSENLSRELQRLEREIEELRTRLANEAVVDLDRTRARSGRRLARTSRAESQLIGTRPLRALRDGGSANDGGVAPVASLRAARAERVSRIDGDDDPGPQAA